MRRDDMMEQRMKQRTNTSGPIPFFSQQVACAKAFAAEERGGVLQSEAATARPPVAGEEEKQRKKFERIEGGSIKV